jgi:Tuberin/Rap/ran-GAP
MKEIATINRACYEDEILEKVVIVIFSDIAQEADVKVRMAVCKLLMEICSHCDTKRCLELLDVVEKVLNHPFDLFSLENVSHHEHDFEDSITVVNGLIDLFLEKLYQLPSSHAVRIYNILVGHLESHYNQPKVFENAVKIRYTIINWMLKIRANSAFQIGYPSPRLISDHFKYTNYLAIEGDFQHPPSTPSVPEIQSNDERISDSVGYNNMTTLSIKRGWEIIVKCLVSEKDWPTVQLVLREIPKILQNKALIQGNDVDILATTLVELFKGNYTKEMFIEHFTTSNEQKDFRALMIPAVASLITYNGFLSPTTRKKIVEVLKSEVRIDGNLSVCVQAFTILLFEKCEIFERQLADIILMITKVSDTVNVAIPILEFLSTLAHLPYSFVNLSQKQFSYVFATCLPYTSPARYDHYIVSLAHHIIASWFLKSRIQWRKGYADYIIEGIAKNIDKSIKDAKSQQKQALADDAKDFPVNEDSSLRKRSSSLTEQSSRKREINNPNVLKMKQKVQSLQNANNFDMHAFHIELIETCIDFMTRNTFSLSSALPKRIPAADFLLRGGGQTKTWVVGHNVVTITTNACMDNHDWKSCACYCSDWAEITFRKPSSMVSWLMKFENQVGVFANDFSFHDLTALFSDRQLDSGNPSGILVRKKNEGSDNSLVDELPLERSMEKLSFKEEEPPLKIPLQSTASDSSVFTFPSQPINIPSKPEAESAAVDDDDVSYDDEDSDDPKRNPVRRVNSSPEMRSNWKMNMSMNKASKSGSGSKDTVSDEHEEAGKIAEGGEMQQKKKSSYSKETKVSCEAIPEEVVTAGHKEDSFPPTRPIQLLSSISAQETANVTTVPKKQHSADDTFQLRRNDSNTGSPALPPINKSQEWSTASSSNLPLSPRYGNKHALVTRQVSHQAQSESDDTGIRARSKTISVIRRNKEAYVSQGANSDFSVSTSSFEQSQPTTLAATSGISPSFVFVQLFSSGKFNSSETLPVTENHMSTLRMLDLIPPFEIHKIGVLYVAQGQANNETEILRNRHGSLRYTQFLHNLGSLIAIKDAKEKKLFVNMEPKREGNFTYVWHDEIIQMTFHVATLM